MSLKRIFLGLGALIAVIMIAASVALWLFLSRWVPVEGKARIIEEVERRWPVTATIGGLRYGVLQGLVLEEVRIDDRRTGEILAAAPAIRIQIARLPLLRRRVAFRGRVALERPFPADVTLAGAYSLRDRSLTLSVQTADIPLRGVTEPLAHRLPPALQDGSVRASLSFAYPPAGLPELAGRITGTGLSWVTPTWRAAGDVVFNGSAAPSSLPGGRWSIHGNLLLDEGMIDGLPVVATISRLQGRAKVLDDRIEVDSLSGIALDSPWTMEGTLTLAPLTVEAFLTARQQLAPAAARLPRLAAAWQPEGTAVLQAVCRGPIAPTAFFDCLARADLQNAVLTGQKLIEPITAIRGTLAYDALTRRLTLSRLNGRLRGKPITVDGEAMLGRTPRLSLRTTGTVPLEAVGPWLPPETPVRELGGQIDVELDLVGPLPGLQPTGTITVHGGSAALATPTVVLEAVDGAIHLTPEAIRIDEAAMQLNGRPLELRGVMTRQAQPELTLNARFPEGELQAQGRLTTQTLLIDEAHLTLPVSRLTLQGRIAKDRTRASAVSALGLLDFSELTSLPFLPLPALEAWQLRGRAQLKGEYEGLFSDPAGASIRARIQSDHLEVRGIPLDQVDCTFEQRRGALRLQMPSARLADGRLNGELRLEQRPDGPVFSVQTDVTGMDLAKLGQAIPAWRDRAVSGNASTHAALSGHWPTRASWQGEGWLNAEGEGLGHVPLLERFFRMGLIAPLAEWLGLEPMRRAEIRQVSLRWQLAKERVKTDDLRLVGVAGAATVVLYARGSVGLDKSIEFEVEPEFSEHLVRQSGAIGSAATVLPGTVLVEAMSKVARYHLDGTLDHPHPHFRFTPQEALKWMVERATGGLFEGLFD